MKTPQENKPRRHKWKKGGKGWSECVNCGLIREKHFGMPYIYYMDTVYKTKAYYGETPNCPPK